MNWISVESRLPENFESVIVWGLMQGDSRPQCHEAFIVKREWDSVRDGMKITEITHWMPFPAGPFGVAGKDRKDREARRLKEEREEYEKLKAKFEIA